MTQSLLMKLEVWCEASEKDFLARKKKEDTGRRGGLLYPWKSGDALDETPVPVTIILQLQRSQLGYKTYMPKKAQKKEGKKGSFFKKFYLFIFWPHLTACGILLPWPGIEPGPTAVNALSLNHWTTREFPRSDLLDDRVKPWNCPTLESPHFESSSYVR